jgi:PAN domain
MPSSSLSPGTIAAIFGVILLIVGVVVLIVFLTKPKKSDGGDEEGGGEKEEPAKEEPKQQEPVKEDPAKTLTGGSDGKYWEEPNMDYSSYFNSSNVEQTAVRDPAECKNICSITTGCIGFTYKQNEEKCNFFQLAPSDAVSSVHMITGKDAVGKPTLSNYPASAFSGSTITSFVTPTEHGAGTLNHEVCKQICMASYDNRMSNWCGGYSYYDGDKGKRCRLLNKLTQNTDVDKKVTTFLKVKQQ